MLSRWESEGEYVRDNFGWKSMNPGTVMDKISPCTSLAMPFVEIFQLGVVILDLSFD
jgi:hypothetical protein